MDTFIHCNKTSQFLVEFFVSNREMPTNSEQDEIRKNRSCEDINTDRYLEELQSAKKKKENRKKAAEKRAKERAIEKNIDISSHQGEAEEGQEERMLENIFYDLWFLKGIY